MRPPPEGAPDALDIAPIVQAVMQQAVPPHLAWMAYLHDEWPSIVGATVAAHTRPGQLMGECLHVYVDSAAWLHELKRFGRDRILNRVREALGEGRVSSLRLVPDPGERG